MHCLEHGFYKGTQSMKKEYLVFEISNPKGEYTFGNKVGRMAERMQMNVEKSIP